MEQSEIQEAFKATRIFTQKSNKKALFELAITLIPYVLGWLAAHHLLEAGSWLFLIPVIVLGLLVIRLFLLFHDCLHMALFPKRQHNQICSFLLGLLYFVPSQYWTEEHNAHHATSQNLDRRGRGDVYLMTVDEYKSLTPFQKLLYRAARSFPGLFIVEIIGRWIFLYRLPSYAHSKRAARGIMWTNLGVAIVVALQCWLMGWVNYVIIQGLMMLVGGLFGVWIFVLQHEFPEAQWFRDGEWDKHLSPWLGSSFFDVPKPIHWLLNNATYHHIHHLNPAVPGYNLAQCHASNPIFATAPRVTLKTAAQSWKCQLWDEQARRITSIAAVESNAH